MYALNSSVTFEVIMAAPQHIYHISNQSDWDSQADSIEYSLKSLDVEGFIHCSKFEQIPATLKRFFAEHEDILIFKIDTKRLASSLIYEASSDGSGFFPHAFGPINKSSIIEIYQFPFDDLLISKEI